MEERRYREREVILWNEDSVRVYRKKAGSYIFQGQDNDEWTLPSKGVKESLVKKKLI